jgi:hypothetical protein
MWMVPDYEDTTFQTGQAGPSPRRGAEVQTDPMGCQQAG